MPQIDPKFAAYINAAFVILTLIGAGLPHLPGVPDAIGMDISAWSLWFAGAVSALNGVFHWWSPSIPGPGVK